MEQAQPEAATASPPTCSWTDHFTGSCKLIIKNASGKRVQVCVLMLSKLWTRPVSGKHLHGPMQLVWLSYDGTEHIYNVLEDGQETQQGTGVAQLRGG